MARKNLEKLVMVRALVKEEARRGRWDQESWTSGLRWDPETKSREITCGSTACVAGWAVYMDRGQFIDNDWVKARDGERRDAITVDLCNGDGNFVEHAQGVLIS